MADLDDTDRRWALERIATVLADRGEFAAAVKLYEEAGDLAAVERIARRLVDDLYIRDATESNRRLLEALRRPLGRPLVLDVLDGVLTLLDRPERARPILEDAARRSRPRMTERSRRSASCGSPTTPTAPPTTTRSTATSSA